MTPDEQEFRSIHYLYRGYRLIPLSSGRFAVAEALPSSVLIHIAETAEEAFAALTLYQPSKGAHHVARENHSDISGEELGGIEIPLF